MARETHTPSKSAATLPGLFRRRDFPELGLSYGRLETLLRRGEVERVSRGLYRRTDLEPTEHETIALVCAKAPEGVVCLLSALRVHELGTQSPREVWLAIDRKARAPKFPDLPVRIVRFSENLLRLGVESRELSGVTVRLTDPARTVVDCFRYRNKIGLDVGLEALRDLLRTQPGSGQEVLEIARACRAETVVRPYLESAMA